MGENSECGMSHLFEFLQVTSVFEKLAIIDVGKCFPHFFFLGGGVINRHSALRLI